MITPKNFFKQLIIESIDAGELEERNVSSVKEYLESRIFSEAREQIAALGIKKAIEEWIRGMSLDIPYTDSDIHKIGVAYGPLDMNSSDDGFIQFAEDYWSEIMPNEILKIIEIPS